VNKIRTYQTFISPAFAISPLAVSGSSATTVSASKEESHMLQRMPKYVKGQIRMIKFGGNVEITFYTFSRQVG
jgi:hypothetical protein